MSKDEPSDQWKEGSARWRRMIEVRDMQPHPELGEADVKKFNQIKEYYVLTGEWIRW